MKRGARRSPSQEAAPSASSWVARPNPDELALILTADCNLRCRYCYQDAKGPRTMPWPVATAALWALLAQPARPVTVWFTGGEPALQWPLLERAVGFADAQVAEAGRRGPAGIAYHIATNGLLLGEPELAFLAAHDVGVTLSMDGVAAAQEVRGAGTFAALDELLGSWSERHPAHFRQRCRVAVTVARPGIPHLGESIRHLFARGVRDILLQPEMGAAWTPADLERLGEQLAAVGVAAAEHHRGTGEVPLIPFRNQGLALRGRSGRPRWACAAPSGRSLAVDVDGQVYPCALAARSYQRIETREAGEPLARLALGDIRDGFEKLTPAEDAAAASGLFAPKRLQHSGERRCATCRARTSCLVCPIGRTWGAATDDPHAVPDSLCAFNRLVHQHACRFRTAAGIGGAGSDRVLRWVFSRRPTRGVTT